MKNRVRIGIALCITVILGLLSRTSFASICTLYQVYGGDVLWASMMYFVFAFLFENRKRKHLVVLTLAFSLIIECSQILQWDLLVYLRSTPLRYLLGQGFVWSDLICYVIGVMIAYGIDCVGIRKENEGNE